jgi:fermentation-respiration switch protein FrsA (DUF1100 family)
MIMVIVTLIAPASPATADSRHAKNPRPTEYAVGSQDATFTDSTRPTASNGTFQGAPFRALPVLILYPAAGAPGGPITPAAPPATDAGPFPLIVFSHGFMSNGPAYTEPLLHALASHGFVVAAPTFPLSSGNAPGGSPKLDYESQPGDVSFVIDEMLKANRGDGALADLIAPKQIGAMGHSLGAVTTFGAVYNTAGRDRRIKAAVPMSGIQLPFAGGRWSWPATPLLLIHGDKDETGPYAGSVRAFGKAKPPKFLLRLIGAPHEPFAAPWIEPLVRTTDSFFDRYLRGDTAGLARMKRAGNVPKVSKLIADPH